MFTSSSKHSSVLYKN